MQYIIAKTKDYSGCKIEYSDSHQVMLNGMPFTSSTILIASVDDARQIEVQIQSSFNQADTICVRLGQSLSMQFDGLSTAEIAQAIAVLNRLTARFNQSVSD